MLATYASLLLGAFLAATILPFSSEAMLATLLVTGDGDPWTLIGVATAGNVAGSAVNWCLGRFIAHWRDKPWFPVSAQAFDRAAAWFRRWGAASLLMAWVPVMGDPLTVVAGAFRVPFWVFVSLVAIGKLGRYAALAATLLWWQSGT